MVWATSEYPAGKDAPIPLSRASGLVFGGRELGDVCFCEQSGVDDWIGCVC